VKKILIALMILVMITGVVGFAATEYDEQALKLKTIGVFVGTDKGFELDRAPSRVEGAIMFVRLLGKESEAVLNNYSHPFNDVPSWGNPYVGYLYNEGLTFGIGDGKFGSMDEIDARSYLTFMLRALGYDDTAGDFQWANALSMGNSIGLVDQDFNDDLATKTFLRDHVARISYDVLSQNMKDGTQTLVSKLVSENAISEADALGMGLEVKAMSRLFSTGTPLAIMAQQDLDDIGAGAFVGTDAEIAQQIVEWQQTHMIYADSTLEYSDVSYSMRWNYAFPGLYTSTDMTTNMVDGDKYYGICYNYAVLYAEIANAYDLEVRITNTTVKPSEVSDNPFYSATATGMSPDEYEAFRLWIVAKGYNEEDYPYEAVRMVMAETALHYRAEVKLDDEWVPMDGYRAENEGAKAYTYVETSWQEGNQNEVFLGFVERVKAGDDLRGSASPAAAYLEFLQGRLIRLEMGELDTYTGITDDLGNLKRAATQNDLFEGYGLAPYFNDKADVLAFFDNAEWLNEEIDELMEIKRLIEANSNHKFYVVAEIIINSEEEDTAPYASYSEQYLGYTGEDILLEEYNAFVK
jgi:hypothetical protein